jgi:uncharacterized protein
VNGAAGPWTNVWREAADYRGPKTEAVDLTAPAAGHNNVMVRFHYYNAVYEWWWEIDEVQIGSCVVSLASVPSLSPSTANQSGQPGAVVTYTLQMSNTGNLTDTFALSASGNAWPAVVSPVTATLAPQQSAPLTVTVTIPNTAPGNGTDVALIRMAGLGASAYSQLTTQANVVRGMQLSAAPSAQNGRAGQAIFYSVWLTNTGNLSDAFTLSLGAHLWPTVVQPISATVAAFTTSPFTVTVTVPFTVTAGMTDTVEVTATGIGTAKAAVLNTTALEAYHVWLPLIIK